MGDANVDPAVPSLVSGLLRPMRVAHVCLFRRLEEVTMVFHRQPSLADPDVHALVQKKAGSLIGKARLTRQDQGDIEQDLAVHIAAPLERYDPSRSPVEAYVRLLLDSAGDNILRQALATKRYCSRPHIPLHDWDEGLDPARARRSCRDRQACEDRLDVEAILAGLDPADRELFRAVATTSVAEVARSRGVPRSTIQDRMGRLKRHLCRKYFPQNE